MKLFHSGLKRNNMRQMAFIASQLWLQRLLCFEPWPLTHLRATLCYPSMPSYHHSAAQWQKIITIIIMKWNVKSKRSQGLVFTTGLTIFSGMEKCIYCSGSLYLEDINYMEMEWATFRLSFWIRCSSRDKNCHVVGAAWIILTWKKSFQLFWDNSNITDSKLQRPTDFNKLMTQILKLKYDQYYKSTK